MFTVVPSYYGTHAHGYHGIYGYHGTWYQAPLNYTANYRVNGGPVIMLVYTEPPSCAVKYRPLTSPHPCG